MRFSLNNSSFKNTINRSYCRLLRFIKHHTIITAACISIFVLGLCYIYDNTPHSLSGSSSAAQRYEIIKATVFGSEDKIPDDILLINIAYDKKLVEYYDSLQPDFAAGYIAITNRGALLDLLEILSEEPTYRYIMCDVKFESDVRDPEYDEALFEAINKTPRLVIPMHEGEEPKDERLLNKAAYCDYAVNIVESNFVKYEFLKNGYPSMPLKVYNDLTGKQISKHGLIYTSDYHLCRKCVELKFPVRLYSNGIAHIKTPGITAQDSMLSATRRIYYNLGSDLLDMGVDIPKKAKDKIVVIGDFSGGDTHTTYLGNMPGAVINYNALCALFENDHIIYYGEIVFLFLLYFFISIYILRGRIVLTYILPRKLYSAIYKSSKFRWLISVFRQSHSKGVSNLILSIVGISAFLWLISAICYIVSGIIVYIFIPTIIFTFLKKVFPYDKLCTI